MSVKTKLNIINKALFSFFLVGVGSVFAMDHNQSQVEVKNPWVRSAPPNAPMLGAFMQIHNNTKNNLKLLSVNVFGYQRAELHKTINHDGLMKMVQQEFIPISAKSSLSLKPGSWHIMLIGPDAVPVEGDTVKIKLIFDNGTSQMIDAVVRKDKMMMKHHGHHH
jgi:copper(I)-binding protein